MFGLVPALQASKQDVQTVLKQDGAGSGRRTGGWLRGALIGVQVAVCMVLLISAGLLMRALYAAQTVEPGFDYRDVAVVSFDLRGPGYDDAESRRVSAAVDGAGRCAARRRCGRAGGQDAVEPRAARQTMFRLPGQEQWHEVDVNTVSPEYFSLIAIPIVRGRTLHGGRS